MTQGSDFTASPLEEWSGQQMHVREGSEWVYRHARPKALTGQRYRVVRCVPSYPSEQTVAIMEGLTGPDAGGWFACTLSVLAVEFAPAPPAAEILETAPREGIAGSADPYRPLSQIQ